MDYRRGAVRLRDLSITLQWLDLIDPMPIGSSWVVYYNADADNLFGTELITQIFTRTMTDHPGAFLYDHQARTAVWQMPKR
jgi:hypothetical protein